MLSEHGSAPRRRKSRASRFAVPLAIPAALGLTFGVVMVISHGGTATTVAQSALGTCASANGGSEGVFIDATILSPNGQLQVYNPLVIDQGTKPAVAPVAPTIAAGSQVIISVGANGNAVALVGPGIRQGNCIDALGNSL